DWSSDVCSSDLVERALRRPGRHRARADSARQAAGNRRAVPSGVDQGDGGGAMTLRLGSLCTGYGGLDLAAETVLGPLTHAWHAEIDPHAAKVLAHHWPDVPNLGDLTAVDWARVEPVDVLTAGYPCQPLSLAGPRAGMNDERWIWDGIYAAICALRPRLVLLENVAGHLSLGFGRVLGCLAAAGFDAEWGCFRASDVGAPHRRERVFIVAWPATDPPRLGHCWHGGTASGGRIQAAAVAGGAGAGELTLLPTPTAARYGYNQSPSPGAAVRPSLDSLAREDRWGQYAPAIARWAQVIGRPAPDPTEPGRDGRPRLSPRFVEWLMGLPPGHVTDHVGCAAALRTLGNGVVPQQAAHAYAELLAAA